MPTKHPTGLIDFTRFAEVGARTPTHASLVKSAFFAVFVAIAGHLNEAFALGCETIEDRANAIGAFAVFGYEPLTGIDVSAGGDSDRSSTELTMVGLFVSIFEVSDDLVIDHVDVNEVAPAETRFVGFTDILISLAPRFQFFVAPFRGKVGIQANPSNTGSEQEANGLSEVLHATGVDDGDGLKVDARFEEHLQSTVDSIKALSPCLERPTGVLGFRNAVNAQS